MDNLNWRSSFLRYKSSWPITAISFLLLYFLLGAANPFCLHDRMACIKATRGANQALTEAFLFIGAAEAGLLEVLPHEQAATARRLDTFPGYREIVLTWGRQEITRMRHIAVATNRVSNIHVAHSRSVIPAATSHFQYLEAEASADAAYEALRIFSTELDGD